MKQIGNLIMDDLKIEVKAIWHIIIEPDYEIKDKPPFPPKIKVYIAIPDTKYGIIEPIDSTDIDKVCYKTGYLEGQSFGFIIRYDFDKDIYEQITYNVRNLNRKYHLNIDEDYRIGLIKDLYSNDSFRYDRVDIKSVEKITLSKEYIEERILNHVR